MVPRSNPPSSTTLRSADAPRFLGLDPWYVRSRFVGLGARSDRAAIPWRAILRLLGDS